LVEEVQARRQDRPRRTLHSAALAPSKREHPRGIEHDRPPRSWAPQAKRQRVQRPRLWGAQSKRKKQAHTRMSLWLPEEGSQKDFRPELQQALQALVAGCVTDILNLCECGHPTYMHYDSSNRPCALPSPQSNSPNPEVLACPCTKLEPCFRQAPERYNAEKHQKYIRDWHQKRAPHLNQAQLPPPPPG